IGLRGGSEPVSPLAKENLVHVNLKNLFLGQHVLELERRQDLVNFSGVALFRRQIHIARHLHGDGRGALALGAPQVGQRGTQHAPVVHAVVLEKTRIFDGQDRIFHHLWNVLEWEQISALFAKLTDQLAIGCQNPQRELGTVVGQTSYVWQVGVRNRQGNAHGTQNSQNTGERKAS